MTQLPLNFASAATRKKAGPELARKMIAYLSLHPKRWVTRKELMEIYGWKDTRYVRLGREASNERVVYSQNGFKLLKYCTVEEYNEYDNRLACEERAAKERRRKAAIRYHARTNKTLAA